MRRSPALHQKRNRRSRRHVQKLIVSASFASSPLVVVRGSCRAGRVVVVVLTFGQVAYASLDCAVRAAASRLVAVARSWAAQASPDYNSELSAQVALRKLSPIASGSDALRSQGYKSGRG